MARRLPPLNALRVFEAVARLGNARLAADELCVTPGAVSKQLRALEEDFGAPLFQRHGGQLTLNKAGADLARSAGGALDDLETAYRSTRRSGSGTTRFTISTTASFAGYFLAPRLDSFEQAFPDLRLRISTTSRLIDFSKESVDMAVRYGRGDWPGMNSEPLCTDALIPVTARHYKNALTARLIHHGDEAEWRAWFEAAGENPTGGATELTMDDRSAILQATLAGYGAALLPGILAMPLIESGALKQAHAFALPWHESFHIVTPPKPRARALAVADWLKAQASSNAA